MLSTAGGYRANARHAVEIVADTGEVRRRAPLLGEHSNEVLTQFLHFSAEEINQLVIAGAVETGPKDAERIMTSGPGENK